MSRVIKTKTLQSTLVTENYNVPPDLYNLIIGDAPNPITVTFPDISTFSNLFETTVYNNSPHIMNVEWGASPPDSIAPLTTKKYITVNNTLLNISSSGSGFDPAGFIKLDGTSQMSGAFNAGSNRVINARNPTAPQDAVTKNYIDTNMSGISALKTDGTNSMTANLNAGSFVVVNVANPTSAQDAATKSYVDGAIAAAVQPITTTALKIDGTVPMTGDLKMGGHKIQNVVDPVDPQGAATKAYADQEIAKRVKVDGSVSMTGNLNMGTQNVVNVGTPTSAQDAATKAYVDDSIIALNLDAVYLKPDGSSILTADLNMGLNRLMNVADSPLPNSAATKAYVDSLNGSYSMHALIPRFDYYTMPIQSSHTSIDNYRIASAPLDSLIGQIFNIQSSAVIFDWRSRSPRANALYIYFTAPRLIRYYAFGIKWNAPVKFSISGRNGSDIFNLVNYTDVTTTDYAEYRTISSKPVISMTMTFDFNDATNVIGMANLESLLLFPYND